MIANVNSWAYLKKTFWNKLAVTLKLRSRLPLYNVQLNVKSIQIGESWKFPKSWTLETFIIFAFDMFKLYNIKINWK